MRGYENGKRDDLINGFENGFNIGFKGPVNQIIARNHPSIFANADAVDSHVRTELSKGRIAGPFTHPPFPSFICSPIALIPKKEPGKFRLIHDLSYPKGKGVNAFIDRSDSAVSYESLDTFIKLVMSAGRNALMAKTDIEEAFRIIPVSPENYPLLGLQWKNKFYFDKCLTMGAASSCKIFESFSVALQWIMRKKLSVKNVSHILDDFLFVGHSDSRECHVSLSKFISLCNDLGVPIKHSKTVPPATTIIAHGFEIDSKKMEFRLPDEKLQKGRLILKKLCLRKKVTLKELQSAIGFLQFSCKAIAPGRTFLRRLIDLTIGVTKPSHRIRLTREARADLAMWSDFFYHYNGKSLFLEQEWIVSEKLSLFTDASGSHGYGGVLGKRWFHGLWPDSWKDVNICTKELFPVTLAFELWGASLANHKVLIRSDNIAVVDIINSQTSKDTMLMVYLRRLVLATLKYNIQVKAQHISGKINRVADFLSRSMLQKAHQEAPWLQPSPSLIPGHLMP